MSRPLAPSLAFWLVGILPAIGQTSVRVADVRHERIQQRQAVTGTIRAVARGDVAALENGRLEMLDAREGDLVQAGEIVAKIDQRRLRAQIAASQAERSVIESEVTRHKARARQADSDLIRGKNLIARNAISRQEFDAYQAAADAARAETDSALRTIDRIDQEIKLLQIRLSDTEIQAPYDATVVSRHVEVGDWVQSGEPLLTLVSTGDVKAWLEVPERFSSQEIRPQGLTVRSAATEQPLDVLTVRRVPDVNPAVRTIPFVATIANPAGDLTPGMSVRAWIPSGREDHYLTVPKDALVRRSGQAVVFAVGESSKAEQVAVRVLFENATRIAVSSSELEAGMKVVVEGNERLLADQTVSVTPVSTEPAFALVKR
ncbi:MAG: efflux RND transporter periplasmic adaptor subunit [Planctomycetota bacterium]